MSTVSTSTEISLPIDFLEHQQPTATTVLALWYLHHFATHGTWQKDFAFEKRLRDCGLDYTTGSLKRINELLRQIHKLKPNPDTFFQHANHRAFVFTVAFYCGEVRGRLAQAAPIWQTWQEFTHQKDDLAQQYPHCLEYQFVCVLPNQDYFFPFKIILNQLFDSEPTSSLYHDTISHYTHSDSDSDSNSNPESEWDSTILPPPPPQSLNFNIHQALCETPAELLPYLQMLPAPKLYGDELMNQIRSLSILYNSGRVVWAAMVHAEDRLLSHGDSGAARMQIIYDPTGRTPASQLDQLAEHFYQYQQDNPQIIGEHHHSLQQPVPEAVSHLPLVSSTMWVWRPHLPNGLLTLPVFPILIADETPAATILPARYWANTAWYARWLQQQAHINEQNSPAETLSSQETTYAFEHILHQQADFWANYHELLSPQAEQIPHLGSQAQYHNVVPHESDQRYIHLCRANAMLNYARAQEQRPPVRQVEDCVQQIKQNQEFEPFDNKIKMYAKLRLLNWADLLTELEKPYENSRLLPQTASIIQREHLGEAHIAKLVDFLQEQRWVHQNTTAMLYLSYLYYSGKLVPQFILEAESCLKTAYELGDYRATHWLAEIVLVAPERIPILLADEVVRESQKLIHLYEKNKHICQYDEQELKNQQRQFLHDPFAQLEQVRRLFQLAAEQGHPTALSRLQQCIQDDRLPEQPSEKRFVNITEWLKAHFQYEID